VKTREERRQDKTKIKTNTKRRDEEKRMGQGREEKFGLFVGCVQSQVLSMATCPWSNWVC
jgi:hypothetical protein